MLHQIQDNRLDEMDIHPRRENDILRGGSYHARHKREHEHEEENENAPSWMVIHGIIVTHKVDYFSLICWRTGIGLIPPSPAG